MGEIYDDIRCIQAKYAKKYMAYRNARRIGADCGNTYRNLVQSYLPLNYLLCLEEFLETDLTLIDTILKKW